MVTNANRLHATKTIHRWIPDLEEGISVRGMEIVSSRDENPNVSNPYWCKLLSLRRVFKNEEAMVVVGDGPFEVEGPSSRKGQNMKSI